MKKTAVEWLVEQMFKQGYFDGNKPLTFTNLDHLQQQAKEMEKEQQSYSEEEVIELLKERCKYFGTSSSPFNKLLLKQNLEWFEQFKKK